MLPWVSDVQALGRLECVSKEMKERVRPNWSSKAEEIETEDEEFRSLYKRDTFCQQLGSEASKRDFPKEVVCRFHISVICTPSHFRWNIKVTASDGKTHVETGQCLSQVNGSYRTNIKQDSAIVSKR